MGNEERTKTVVVPILPQWMNRTNVVLTYSIPRTRLKKLVDEGILRTKKLGPESRANLLFKVSDIEDYMNE